MFLGLGMCETTSAASTHQSYILNIKHTEHQECVSLALASQSWFHGPAGWIQGCWGQLGTDAKPKLLFLNTQFELRYLIASSRFINVHALKPSASIPECPVNSCGNPMHGERTGWGQRWAEILTTWSLFTTEESLFVSVPFKKQS